MPEEIRRSLEVPEAVPWGWRHMFARHLRLDQRANYGISEEKQDNRAGRETPECTLEHSRVPVSIEPDRLIAQSCTLATAGTPDHAGRSVPRLARRDSLVRGRLVR
jgi:hypothetical protein